ncbi:MAG: 30S ribosomal protein S7 [bacterium]|nr:30S ribosomal protein S7 [bacterium]
MPRGTHLIRKRAIEDDPVYKSRLVTRFINRLMRSGKKSVARHILYGVLETLKEREKKNPVEVLETAIQHVAPQMEVRPRRVGGASYQVPMEVRGDRREALAIRWILQAASSRPNSQYKTMQAKLAAELLDAAQNQGTAMKKRDDVHRMAEANRAFAHFRW